MPAGLGSFDPLSLAASATSSGLQSLGGLFQTLFSGRKKAQRNLENLPNPTYGGNKAVNDYYNEAYNRAMTSPENSALYQNALQGINRNSSNLLSGMQDRRSALDSVGQIAASQNQGLNNALVNAEQQRNQRFGMLGNATNMKSQDDANVFQVNTIMPFQRKLNLLSTKAANANQTFNTGLSNIFGGISNGAMLAGNSGMSYGGGQQQAQGIAPINFGNLSQWQGMNNEPQPSNYGYAPYTNTYGE